MASMHSFAPDQRTLLRSAGVPVRQWRSEAAFYAGNALSTTLPGGPVLSATFIYRQQRIWGASPVVASWQLVMSGAMQVIGLALLGLGGAFLLGAKHKPAVADLHPRRIPRADAAGPGGGVATRLDRRDRRSAGDVVQLVAGQTRRHRPAQVARDTRPAGVGQPEPPPAGCGVRWSLFNWSPASRCLLFATYAAGGQAVAGGRDRRLSPRRAPSARSR